jgi:hypothetical protein
MTCCCTRAVHNSAIAHTRNLLSKVLYLQMYGLLPKIYVYEKCLC